MDFVIPIILAACVVFVVSSGKRKGSYDLAYWTINNGELLKKWRKM